MSTHLVQFYDQESFFVDSALHFVDDGQCAGDAVIVIATADHLRQIDERLKRRHRNWGRAPADYAFVRIDADEALGEIMVDRRPDERRFLDFVGPRVAAASEGGARAVRVFAEVVGLLCARGSHEAAIELEQLWNRFGARQPLHLQCAYPMAAFADTQREPAFSAVCSAHAHVYPSELPRDALSDPDELRRTIAVLQQRIATLESELGSHRDAGSLAERQAVDMAALAQAYAELERVANLDPLTGLYNRRVFIDRLEHALERAKRRRNSFALLLVDLDDFKSVNDRLGHEAGDLLLREVALRLGHCARGSDTVCRLGGDEFTVIMEDCTLKDAAMVAQRIVDALDQELTIDGATVVPTASVGVGVYPDDAADAAALIRSADQAMYRAKGHGKGRYEDSGPAPL